jgi:uncharacterized protein YndB with AHSA1/START domain
MSKTQITAEPGMPLVIISREFDAPRELVLRAYTDPELLAQWLGPRDLVMTVKEWEPHDGGRWRYVHADADGNEYAFHGVFHGEPTADGVIQTFEFEGAPGHVSLDSYAFTDLGGGRTLVRSVSSFQSVADRDAMVAADMERGIRDSGDRLGELLARLG